MKFKIGQTVSRQDPGGYPTTWDIDSDKAVTYHTGLQESGYKYTDISKGVVADFDLPEVAPNKPRVHQSNGESVCTACEG